MPPSVAFNTNTGDGDDAENDDDDAMEVAVSRVALMIIVSYQNAVVVGAVPVPRS